MRLDRYVFGSVRGYGQLARSPGISDADAKAFDAASMGFGQVNDGAFIASLANHPAFFTQPVRGGRWAVVRVLGGREDDNGRPTLILLWLVLDRDEWESQLGGNPQTLLDTADLWKYEGQSTLPTLQITVPAATPFNGELPDRLRMLLGEVLKNAGNQRSTVVSASEYSPADLAAITAAAPAELRSTMTVAYRGLSAKFPVTLNAVADEARVSLSGARAGISVAASAAGSLVGAGLSMSASTASAASAVQSMRRDTNGVGFDTSPQLLEEPGAIAYKNQPRSVVPSPPAKSAMFATSMGLLAVLAIGGPVISYVAAHNQSRQQMLDLQQSIDLKFKEQSNLIGDLQQKIKGQEDQAAELHEQVSHLQQPSAKPNQAAEVPGDKGDANDQKKNQDLKSHENQNRSTENNPHQQHQQTQLNEPSVEMQRDRSNTPGLQLGQQGAQLGAQPNAPSPADPNSPTKGTPPVSIGSPPVPQTPAQPKVDLPAPITVDPGKADKQPATKSVNEKPSAVETKPGQ